MVARDHGIPMVSLTAGKTAGNLPCRALKKTTGVFVSSFPPAKEFIDCTASQAWRSFFLFQLVVVATFMR